MRITTLNRKTFILQKSSTCFSECALTVIDDFEQEFRAFTQAKHAIACSSGTSALHTALLALGIEPGDKVITSPFSFIASANCILYCQGTPIFADINPKTYCIDPSEVETILTNDPAIRAIICVHLFGNVCDLDALTDLASKFQVPLVEDCAQALGATYNGQHVGTFGRFGTFSFYATKNLSTFEGGMLTTNDADLARTARILINHGQTSRYRHSYLGYNYRMPQICALLGLTTLKLHKTAILAELEPTA